MKKFYLSFVLLAFISSAIKAQSAADADAVKNNLTVSVEYKLVEATAICLDAINSPTEYNAYVTPFITTEGFPKKTTNVSPEELKQNIFEYLKARQEVVENILKERKKAHDQLYGVRPY